MSDELKPRESVDSREFRESLMQFGHACARYPIPDPYEIAGKAADLIAHIDAWGARLAGEAFEQAARICEQRGMHWQKEEGSYAAGKKAGAFDAADHIRLLAASPTPDKEPPCGS